MRQSICIRKHYPWVDLSVKPNFQAISQKSAVLVHQVSSLVFSHTDVLILTFVCGLQAVSVYSIYATVYGMVGNVISIVAGSVQSVFGLMAVTSVLIMPFMALYTAGADIDYLDWKIPLLFTIYQLLSYGRTPSHNPIGFAGKFKETQWRAWLETIINLVVSFVCVFQFGIYGVLVGTVTALLYRANDIIIFANKMVLNRSPWPTYRRWLVNLAVFAVVIITVIRLPLDMSTLPLLFVHALWITPVTLTLFMVVNSIAEPDARRTAMEYVRSMIRSVFKR